VRFIATKKAEQKISKMGYFIFSTALISQPDFFKKNDAAI